ncbi:MAG TPA: DUF5615 family PIN-like protein [Dehalococcoidia bacterium]|nr:DUF5615 family PIN-like protein [Dehalococcoidia bacterium]
MFRIYHDEDSLRIALIQALRRAGFDCLTVNEAEMRGRSDEEQLAFATAERRVIYTRNTRDFRLLDTQWQETGRRHSGIIVLHKYPTSIGDELRAFQAMGARFSAEDMKNRLEFLLNYAELR